MARDQSAEKPSRRRKWVLVLVCVGVCLYLLRGPILRRIAAGLVCSDPVPAAADIMALGGDGASDVALAWLADHADAKLLLAEKPPPRVVQIGATGSEAERRRALAESAGVPVERVEILMGTLMRRIDPVGAIEAWLSDHPDRQIHVLCEQFSSRGLRRAVDRRLSLQLAQRVSLQPLADRRFGIDNWWHTRLGTRGVLDAYLGLTRAVLGLGPPEPPAYLSPEQYEQAFLRSLKLEA